MKKILFLLVCGIFSSNVYANNIISNNPLYKPAQDRYYSITSLETNSTYDLKQWNLTERFGYGITDKTTLEVNGSLNPIILSDNDSHRNIFLDNIGVGISHRVIQQSNWKLDLLGNFGIKNTYKDLIKASDNAYNWSIGVKGGYVSSFWTLAGHLNIGYLNDGFLTVFNTGNHMMNVGVDGQWLLNNYLNLTASFDIAGSLDRYVGTTTYTTTAGLNYNIDIDKYIGIFVNKQMAEINGSTEDLEGYGLGVKFGIDF